MSHSTAAMRFSDGLILYGEYNGTVDVMLPQFYSTSTERDDNWGTHNWPIHDKSCSESEDVIVATSYGRGFSWPAKACRHHLLMIDNLMPFDDDKNGNEIARIDGLPEWYTDMNLYKL